MVNFALNSIVRSIGISRYTCAYPTALKHQLVAVSYTLWYQYHIVHKSHTFPPLYTYYTMTYWLVIIIQNCYRKALIVVNCCCCPPWPAPCCATALRVSFEVLSPKKIETTLRSGKIFPIDLVIYTNPNVEDADLTLCTNSNPKLLQFLNKGLDQPFAQHGRLLTLRQKNMILCFNVILWRMLWPRFTAILVLACTNRWFWNHGWEGTPI